jgi:hypothetical protein
MTPEQKQQFQSDFMTKYGINLQIGLSSYQYLGGDNNQKHFLFAERAEQLVLLKIRECNPRFQIDKASNFQKKEIWEATLEQAFYMYMSGDVTLISGFDPTTGSVIPLDELKKRQFSDIARTILLQSGLLYGGLDSSLRSRTLL